MALHSSLPCTARRQQNGLVELEQQILIGARLSEQSDGVQLGAFFVLIGLGLGFFRMHQTQLACGLFSFLPSWQPL